MNKSSLLVVGSVALDSVETRAGKRVEVLGGAATYFSVAASFLVPTPVRLTGVVGDDFADAHTQLLKSRGVDLAGLEPLVDARDRGIERTGRHLLVALLEQLTHLDEAGTDDRDPVPSR